MGFYTCVQTSSTETKLRFLISLQYLDLLTWLLLNMKIEDIQFTNKDEIIEMIKDFLAIN